MKVNYFKLVMRGCLAIILTGFSTYFIIAFQLFKEKGKYNNEFVELANFGSYNSYFIYICNLILLGFISYITYQSTNKYNKHQTTPVLEMSVNISTIPGNSDSWFLINCTNGAARNISVRFTTQHPEEKSVSYIINPTSKWIACYSIGGNSSIELPWLKYAESIEVLYSDLFETEFFKLTYRNLRSSIEDIDGDYFREVLVSNRANHASLWNQLIYYLTRDVPGMPNFYIYHRIEAFAFEQKTQQKRPAT